MVGKKEEMKLSQVNTDNVVVLTQGPLGDRVERLEEEYVYSMGLIGGGFNAIAEERDEMNARISRSYLLTGVLGVAALGMIGAAWAKIHSLEGEVKDVRSTAMGKISSLRIDLNEVKNQQDEQTKRLDKALDAIAQRSAKRKKEIDEMHRRIDEMLTAG